MFKRFNYDSNTTGISKLVALSPNGAPLTDANNNPILVDVLTHFHSVTDKMVLYAFNNRTHPRSIQKSENLYS